MKGKPSFNPMPGKIAVEVITEENHGSLIIPSTYAKSRVMGRVVAIGGDEDEGDDYSLAVGDVVLFGPNSGVKVTVDRQEVLIFRTSEILCTVTWPEPKIPSLLFSDKPSET